MSAYPPDQPDSSFGPNFDSMNPWQKAALFMNPKALQIMQYVQQLGAQKEDRDRRRQIFQMEMEDRQRARAHEDFKTNQALSAAGYLPVQPGVVGQFEAGLGGRGTVTAPDNKQYSQPTPAQKFERQTNAAQQAGTLKGIETKAAADVAGIDTVEMDFGDAGKMDVPRSQLIQALRLQQDLKANKYSAHTFQRDDNGNTTFVGIPAGGGDPIKIPLGAIGTTKTAKAESAGVMTPRAESAFNAAQQAINLARAGPKPTSRRPQSEIDKMVTEGGESPDEAQAREAQRLWKLAEDSVTKAVMAHPDELEGGKGDGGFPFIVPKGKVGGSGKRGVTATPAKKQPVPASRLQSLLQHPNVKARGIKDINALRKDLMSHGYTIDDSQ